MDTKLYVDWIHKDILNGNFSPIIPQGRQMLPGSKPVIDENGDFIGTATSLRGAKLIFVKETKELIREGHVDPYDVNIHEVVAWEHPEYYLCADSKAEPPADYAAYIKPYFDQLLEMNEPGAFIDIPIAGKFETFRYEISAACYGRIFKFAGPASYSTNVRDGFMRVTLNRKVNI